jgi:hypothetical protein
MRDANEQYGIEAPRDGGNALCELRRICAAKIRRGSPCCLPREITADRWLISPAHAQKLSQTARKIQDDI